MIGMLASRRILVGFIVMSLTAIVWYEVLYSRQKAELDRLGRELAEVQGQVESWVGEARGLSEYHEAFTTIERKHRQALARIPAIDRLPELSERIVEMGKAQGCRVAYVGMPFSQIFPEDGGRVERGADGLFILPFQVVVKGDFRSLEGLLDDLSGLPFFADFGELEVRRSAGGGAELESQIMMRVYVKSALASREGLS